MAVVSRRGLPTVAAQGMRVREEERGGCRVTVPWPCESAHADLGSTRIMRAPYCPSGAVVARTPVGHRTGRPPDFAFCLRTSGNDTFWFCETAAGCRRGRVRRLRVVTALCRHSALLWLCAAALYRHRRSGHALWLTSGDAVQLCIVGVHSGFKSEDTIVSHRYRCR